jgi:voltage-gated potassium channel
VFLFVVISIAGNALTFLYFERPTQPDLTVSDALWYSIISITTIGYGDFFASTAGARIGTVVFIALIGLAAFTSAVGLGVDWILDQQFKERSGMGSPRVKDHLLIVNFPNERRVRQIIDEYLQDPNHRNDEIVIVTDRIESLPFTIANVHFVRGSVIEEETYRRARANEAKQAIVLSTGYDDSNSDSVVASAISLLQYVAPGIRSVAEVLNASHARLFASNGNVSLVYTFNISNNLIVQEAQDPGVNMLTQAITSNLFEGTLASTKVESPINARFAYRDIAKKLLDDDINLVGVIRDNAVIVNFADVDLAVDDWLVYISSERHDWPFLRSRIT